MKVRLASLVQASGALAILLLTAAAQRLTTTPRQAKAAFNPAQMTRYERATYALEHGEIDSALRQLAPDPEEVLVIPTDLPSPDLKAGGRLPAGTFLYLGGMLARRAREAAENGAAHQAEALLQMCYDLSYRLQKGCHSESAAEQCLRLNVANALGRLAQRTERELATA